MFGDGSQTRSLCFVSDLVQGIEKLLFSDLHDPVNMGNPDELTMLQLAKKIAALAGAGSDIVYKPLPEDDPKVRQPDISIAKSRLCWSPQIPLAEGLKITLDYFRSRISEASPA